MADPDEVYCRLQGPDGPTEGNYRGSAVAIELGSRTIVGLVAGPETRVYVRLLKQFISVLVLGGPQDATGGQCRFEAACTLDELRAL